MIIGNVLVKQLLIRFNEKTKLRENRIQLNLLVGICTDVLYLLGK